MWVDHSPQILHLRRQLSGAVAIAGVVVFVTVLGYLHAVQFAYDPVHQFMSELAFGLQGGTLVVAFLALAMSLMALANGLASLGGRHGMPLLLVLSAIRWLSWGLFAFLVASAAVDSAYIPSGISQRLAACALLAWISVFSLRLLRWR